jgi:hypothetical protein
MLNAAQSQKKQKGLVGRIGVVPPCTADVAESGQNFLR